MPENVASPALKRDWHPTETRHLFFCQEFGHFPRQALLDILKTPLHFLSFTETARKTPIKKKVKWANPRIWKGISWIGDLTKKQCGIVRDSRNVNGIRETLTGYRIWLLPRKQNCTGYGIGKNDIESSLMEVRDALFSCKRSGKCAIRTPFSGPYIASMFYVCKKILRYF